VILDSGNVLIRPTNGRWFPPPAFYEVLAERGLSWEPGPLDEGLVAGGVYLDEVHPVPLADEHAEHAVWLRYYEFWPCSNEEVPPWWSSPTHGRHCAGGIAS